MSISLTRDEFMERLQSRHNLLILAMEEDAKNLASTKTNELIAEVLQKTLVRVIKLVYDENLD